MKMNQEQKLRSFSQNDDCLSYLKNIFKQGEVDSNSLLHFTITNLSFWNYLESFALQLGYEELENQLYRVLR